MFIFKPWWHVLTKSIIYIKHIWEELRYDYGLNIWIWNMSMTITVFSISSCFSGLSINAKQKFWGVAQLLHTCMIFCIRSRQNLLYLAWLLMFNFLGISRKDMNPTWQFIINWPSHILTQLLQLKRKRINKT